MCNILNITTITVHNEYTEYGVSSSVSITEDKQRRARYIIGWVTAWFYQVLYIVGHACSDVVS